MKNPIDKYTFTAACGVLSSESAFCYSDGTAYFQTEDARSVGYHRRRLEQNQLKTISLAELTGE